MGFYHLMNYSIGILQNCYGIIYHFSFLVFRICVAVRKDEPQANDS